MNHASPQSTDSSAPASPRRLGRWDWVGIAIASAVLVAVCLIAGGKRPFFWYDELITHLEISDRSVSHMTGVIARGLENNPPLYQILLRAWAAVAGVAPTALRMMSALCVAGAVALLWRALRRELSAPAVAVALGLTFFGADAILDQVAQARHYGLFLLTASIAIAVAIETSRRDRIGPLLWAGTFIAHTLLLYTHTFGVLYSGAIALGAIVIDARRGRFRPVLVTAIGAAWLAFAPWVPYVIEQGKMTEPRMWIPRPGLSRLTGVLERLTSPISFVVIGIAVVVAVIRREGRLPTALSSERFALLAIGVAVAAVAPAVFVESRIARPMFVDRYVIASALGWPLLVALALDAGVRRLPRPVANGAGAVAFVALAASALVAATRRASYTPPVVEVPSSLASVPVVAESALDFLPLKTYGGRSRSYHFPLDWQLAVDRGNAPASVQDFKLMQLAAREGYLGDADVVDGARWLASTDRFLVVDTPEHLWFERRVGSDAAWRASEVGSYGPAARVWLVERRIVANSATPVRTQSSP